MSENQSRRSFLQNLGIGLGTSAAAFAIPSVMAIPEAGSKKDDKKLGIALVGLGSYAKNQLAVALENAKNCYLTAIVTGSPAKAEEWSKKYNLPKESVYNYQNFDEIAKNKAVDIVYVVLPNSLHPEFVIRAAKAGKHVMCEKPMANSVAECEAMIKACKEAGVQLGIGYRMHFEPHTQEIMRIGQKKEKGNVRFIQTNFGFTIGDPTQWRLKKAMAGGGPLMDVGIYCVQASRYVTGEEPLWVTAQFGPITDKERFKDVEESVSWQMEFPGGTIVNGFTSYKSNIEQLYVSADKGWVQLSPAYSYGPIKGSTNDGSLKLPVVHHQTVMMEAICKEFIETGKFPSHIDGEEGKRDMKILMAIYEAAQTGKKISLV
ncbi:MULTISPECIES: Gfo/Idh/MocA family protein [Emticicia]|uniref:Gfo/Idh/MocA family protein n=1 Tax=Emticicia TaxID=312278 RepID=UPI0007D8AC6D|nr:MULTISPECIES: Gfo/Idh/MocA family oxidoreductase [Emticicia]